MIVELAKELGLECGVSWPDEVKTRAWGWVEDGEVTATIALSWAAEMWFAHSLRSKAKDKTAAARLYLFARKIVRESGCLHVRVHSTMDAEILPSFWTSRGFVPTVVIFEGTA